MSKSGVRTPIVRMAIRHATTTPTSSTHNLLCFSDSRMNDNLYPFLLFQCSFNSCDSDWLTNQASVQQEAEFWEELANDKATLDCFYWMSRPEQLYAEIPAEPQKWSVPFNIVNMVSIILGESKKLQFDYKINQGIPDTHWRVSKSPALSPQEFEKQKTGLRMTTLAVKSLYPYICYKKVHFHSWRPPINVEKSPHFCPPPLDIPGHPPPSPSPSWITIHGFWTALVTGTIHLGDVICCRYYSGAVHLTLWTAVFGLFCLLVVICRRFYFACHRAVAPPLNAQDVLRRQSEHEMYVVENQLNHGKY